MSFEYDGKADVLYVNFYDEPAHHATDNDGIVLRYREDGTLIGVTILDVHRGEE